jgi:hypothetical protein
MNDNAGCYTTKTIPNAKPRSYWNDAVERMRGSMKRLAALAVELGAATGRRCRRGTTYANRTYWGRWATC